MSIRNKILGNATLPAKLTSKMVIGRLQLKQKYDSLQVAMLIYVQNSGIKSPLLTERIHHKDTYPLLSCSDIEELLARFLPRRDVTKEEVILQLEHRHSQRQKAIESHARRKKKFGKFDPGGD